MADSEVTLTGHHSETVVVAGGEVRLDGSVGGNLIVAGGSVQLNGLVEQDVFVAGGTVIIDSDVLGNVFAAGGEVQIMPNAEIFGSTLVAGEFVTYQGNSTSDTRLVGETVVIDGVVGGSTWAAADTLDVRARASIAGELQGKYRQLTVDEAAQVDQVSLQQWEDRPASKRSVVAAAISGWFWNVGSGLALFALVFFARPTWLMIGRRTWKTARWETLGQGMVAMITVPIVILLLIVSVIGIPVAFVIGAAWCIALWTGWLAIATESTTWVFPDWKAPEWMRLAGGVVAATTLSSIPVVGWVFQVLLATWGVGVWWRSLMVGNK